MVKISGLSDSQNLPNFYIQHRWLVCVSMQDKVIGPQAVIGLKYKLSIHVSGKKKYLKTLGYKKTLKALNLLLNWQNEVKYFCLVISHTSLQYICPL